MSYAARLVHPITIERTTFNDTDPDDAYGQPEGAQTTVSTRALIQPKNAEEMADALSAGAQVADHTIFLEPQLLYGSDVILDSEGQRYRVTGIRSYEMGRTPHIEVDAMAISRSNDNTIAVGS